MVSPHRSIDREARTRHFEIKIQTSRGIVFTGGVLLAIGARLLGVADYSWSAVCLFFFAANGSAVAFAAAAAKDIRELAGIPVRWLWIGLDIGLFVWVVAVTGGSASIWFPWALTNVAAAAYVIGKRGALLVMAGNLAAYLALVAVTEAEVEGALAAVTVRMLILYAAGFFAVKGVCKLRGRSLRLSDLRAQEGQRAAELQQMTRTIDERSEQLDRLTDELRKVALTDPQTGTYNRRYLKQRIREDLAMVRRSHAASDQTGLYLGFVLLNLDHFQRVNDENGHEGGDEVLRQVSAVLAEVVREMDTVIRWDSDAFLVLLRQINREHLPEVVERMIRGIRSRSFVLARGEQTSLTCSAGFCHYPFGDDAERFTWEDVVKLAANALNLAKQLGRDRWVGLSEGRRALDRVGARLAVEDLAAAEQREYVRTLRNRGD
jgi:diguanylate cyclase (GGDEF)-like protein